MNNLTKRRSTTFLRISLYAIGIAVLGLASLVLPAMYQAWPIEYPELAPLKYPFVLCIGATIIPFFIALQQALQLLHYIDKDTAFSEQSVQRLGVIKYAAFSIACIYALLLFVVYQVAQAEDAPGMILIWSAVCIATPLVIAVFAALVQSVLKNIIDLKSENELTV